MSLIEVLFCMRHFQAKDELAWKRASHLLALIHNVNAKKEAQVTADDYDPYQRVKRIAPPAEITAKKRDLFSYMQTTLNHGK